jgi:two-component system, response regulator, stage 0 sporulation protein F
MAKILVVEDETIPRMILNKVLTRDGHDVRDVASGPEAVQVGRDFAPDLLLADWLLADSYTGLTVAERLREANPNLHLIFFTGLPTHKLEIEAEHLKPFRFIEKPCEFEVLREAIRDALASNGECAATNGQA